MSFRLVAKRSFSSVNPRVTIAKNCHVFSLVKNAKTEAELNAALAAGSTFDVAKAFSGDLGATVNQYIADTPVPINVNQEVPPDMSAWQNKEFGDYVNEEVNRDAFKPFVWGAA